MKRLLSKFWIIISLILIIILLGIFIGKEKEIFPKIEENGKGEIIIPKNLSCDETTLKIFLEEYGLKINEINIIESRCKSGIGFFHKFIKAIDEDGGTFQLYEKDGGLAASGADQYWDVCFISDLKGKNTYQKTKSHVLNYYACTWVKKPCPIYETQTDEFIQWDIRVYGSRGNIARGTCEWYSNRIIP